MRRRRRRARSRSPIEGEASRSHFDTKLVSRDSTNNLPSSQISSQTSSTSSRGAGNMVDSCSKTEKLWSSLAAFSSIASSIYRSIVMHISWTTFGTNRSSRYSCPWTIHDIILFIYRYIHRRTEKEKNRERQRQRSKKYSLHSRGVVCTEETWEFFWSHYWNIR